MELNTSSVIGDKFKEALTLVGNDEDEDVNDDVLGNDSANAELISCKINQFTLNYHLYNLQWTDLCNNVVYILTDRLIILNNE